MPRILKTFFVLVCISLIQSVIFAGSMDDLLLQSIANNNLEMVKTAVKNSANVNYVKPQNYTPLGLAIKNKNGDITAFLLKSGAKPNVKIEMWDYYTTPLILASQNNDLKIAQLLVEAGANVNGVYEEKKDGGFPRLVTYDGYTPLIFAIEKSLTDSPSLPMVEYLISQKANVNQAGTNGYTPLMAASNYKYGNTFSTRCSIAKALLKAGADPAKKDKSGKTALQYAINTNFTDMINLLLPVSPK